MLRLYVRKLARCYLLHWSVDIRCYATEAQRQDMGNDSVIIIELDNEVKASSKFTFFNFIPFPSQPGTVAY